MLILVPAPESKATVGRGKPVDLDRLSFPALGSTRQAVLDALVELSGRPDATAQLGEPSTRRDLVRRNTSLRSAPAAPAEAVYRGPLFDAIGLADLDAPARRRARSWIVAVSALWGAVRPGDRIPAYRLDMCGRLPGLDHLPQQWQAPLAEVLPEAARRGLVVDCRSGEYAVAWRPTGELAERTVVLRVVRDLDGDRGAPSHGAKRTRGLVVRRIVVDGIEARRPAALAESLAGHFALDLRPPRRIGAPWELAVVDAASG
jgi:cytoplasmic iron level regulating protein YaaA (DUF328/UPF0246 family)